MHSTGFAQLAFKCGNFFIIAILNLGHYSDTRRPFLIQKFIFGKITIHPLGCNIRLVESSHQRTVDSSITYLIFSSIADPVDNIYSMKLVTCCRKLCGKYVYIFPTRVGANQCTDLWVVDWKRQTEECGTHTMYVHMHSWRTKL